MAITNIQTGVAAAAADRKYTAAASALEVDREQVVSAVYGLSQILIECAKRALPASDVRASVAELGFDEAHQERFEEVYSEQCASLREFLSQLSLQLPHYDGLDWRLEVQVASRSLRHQAEPKFLLELRTRESTSARTTEAATRTRMLQADHESIQNVLEELETALKAVKGAHANRILRYIH